MATTMVDFYALPQEEPKAWPGRKRAGRVAFAKKAATVEVELRRDVANEMGPRFDQRRFVPFVIVHEFEGLLFSDCRRFAEGIYRPELEAEFQKIRDAFASPEEINDSPDTAPSKRVEKLVPGYQKPLLGTLAMLEVGLAAVRRECRHFDDWLQALESRARL